MLLKKAGVPFEETVIHPRSIDASPDGMHIIVFAKQDANRAADAITKYADPAHDQTVLITESGKVVGATAHGQQIYDEKRAQQDPTYKNGAAITATIAEFAKADGNTELSRAELDKLVQNKKFQELLGGAPEYVTVQKSASSKSDDELVFTRAGKDFKADISKIGLDSTFSHAHETFAPPTTPSVQSSDVKQR